MVAADGFEPPTKGCPRSIFRKFSARCVPLNLWVLVGSFLPVNGHFNGHWTIRANHQRPVVGEIAGMKTKWACIFASAIGFATAMAGNPANAAVQLFDASGSLTNGSILGGTVSIDLVTGTIIASALTFSKPPVGPFTAIGTALPEPAAGLYDFNVNDAGGDIFSSGLHGSSLVGYAGGAFCSNSNPCDNGMASSGVETAGFGSFIGLLTGTLTSEAVPEPASLALLLMSVTGLSLVRRRMA
jgi:hypothetical protein